MTHCAAKRFLLPPLASSRWRALGLVMASVLMTHPGQAQMARRNDHALRQNVDRGNLSTVRIDIDGNGSEVSGKGLNLRGKGFWPHWEGRIGVVIDRPVNPIKDAFVLAQPAQDGLHVRSVHVLSDYYFKGGFRVTAGLLRGETGQAWWSSGDNGGGLNLSLQSLNGLGLLGTYGQQTMPYLGAGYTSRLSFNGEPGAWRLHADLGLMSVNASNINRRSQIVQGDKSLDELVHEMRLRPVIKVSVGYCF